MYKSGKIFNDRSMYIIKYLWTIDDILFQIFFPESKEVVSSSSIKILDKSEAIDTKGD